MLVERMTGMGILFLCMGIGAISRVFRIFPENTPVVLNRFVIFLSLPALTLFHLHRLGQENTGIGISPFLPALMAWIVLLTSIPFCLLLSRCMGWDRRTTGALILTAGLGNTSFVGFALLEALYGPSALPTAVLADSLGTFLAMATVGIAVACVFSGKDVSGRKILKKVLTFPPFLALVASFCLRTIPFPEIVSLSLEKLGATLVPLALTAVGMELRISPMALRRNGLALFTGLTFKLLIAPAIIFAIYFGALGLRGLSADVILLEAAMAPMITGGIIAAEYDLRPELASLMVGVGIPLSLLTVPAIYAILSRL
jgi:malate permease and related proteins